MKSQKTNAFQLAVAGGVLVLVLVCATFAWFASGNFATVSQILASVSAPDVPSQFNSIQYENASGIWVAYNGQELELEPGKTWKFQVYFTAKETDTLTMTLNQISAQLRKSEEISTTKPQTDSEETSKVPVTAYAVVTEDQMLSDVLLVKINDGEFEPLDINGSSAVIVNNKEVGKKPSDQQQYIYTYEIKMAESAGNDYMDKVLSFVLEANLTSQDSTESEG